MRGSSSKAIIDVLEDVDRKTRVSIRALQGIYAVLTPVGWCLRIVGYDPMNRKFDPSAETYWIERPKRVEPSRYFRQF